MDAKSDPIQFDFSQSNPILLVLAGLSGVGKDSVLAELKKGYPQARYIVTFTDRPARKGEVEGVDYHFVSTEQFEAMIANDELVEYSRVYNQYKGGEKKQVQQAFIEGKDVIMRLDVQGAQKIKSKYPDAVLLFLTSKNSEEWKSRLINRKTDSEEQIKVRLETARQELQTLPDFDYLVVNEDQKIAEAVESILAIIKAEHCKVQQRKILL